jgi:hypothetical protein
MGPISRIACLKFVQYWRNFGLRLVPGDSDTAERNIYYFSANEYSYVTEY